jgi:thioester reductase-like protein
MSEHSPIRHEGAATLLNNSSVFITGASGFVGKVLLEKLLRDVPGIDKFYVLIRPKKGVSPSQRLHEEIVSSKIFTVLLRNIGEEKFREIVARKLIAVPGDISHHQCGIPAEFLKEIYRNVRVIFHCAASINFQERIGMKFICLIFVAHGV